MIANTGRHNRNSIRLKGFDYSQAGFYFVTICTQNRECLFGQIIEKRIVLADPGKMIDRWYHEIQNKFIEIQCDEYKIMPNHIHFIIHNKGNVGADQRVCPNDAQNNQFEGEHKGSPLHRIVQWFKTMTTNEYIRRIKQDGWGPIHGKLWQRSYFERIIRNEKELNRIREYVINQPHKMGRRYRKPSKLELIL